MADPFIGEIRMFGGNFAPLGWAFCNGQVLAISANDVLFTLIGTTYGGDGQNTFALPNLQSRVPIHLGPGYVMGQASGEEAHTLLTPELPAHSHAVSALTAANIAAPNAAVYGGGTSAPIYDATPSSIMNSAVVVPNNKGAAAHANIMPYLTVNFIIALSGVYPSQ